MNAGGGAHPRTILRNVRERAALPDRNLTLAARLCRPGETEIRAEYCFPRRTVLPDTRLPSSVNVTDAIRVPWTLSVNARLTQALGTLLSLALTLAALTWIDTEVVAVAELPPASRIVVLIV